MKTLVIYHKADFDGLFSAAACWHWLKGDCELLGWDHGDAKVDASEYQRTFVVDLPPNCIGKIRDSSSVIWIDHHKAAIDEFDQPASLSLARLPGFRIDGVAACRLTWNWFAAEYINTVHGELATKQEFLARSVPEPYALTLAGEYDVWNKQDPLVEEFQFGITARGPWTPEKLADEFLWVKSGDAQKEQALRYCKAGREAMGWQRAFARETIGNGYTVLLGGIAYYCLCSVHSRNSMWFPDDLVPAEAEGLMNVRLDGQIVRVSLYDRESKKDTFDHLKVAKSYGGGGHRGACGFEVPFEEAVKLRLIR